MNAEILDIYIARGATFAIEAEYADAEEHLVPFPEGWSGKAQVRTDPGGDLLLELAVVLQDPGIIVVSASDEATEAMPAEPARGVWDLIVTDPAANRWPILAGEVSIRTVVTER